jgi:hypothetical protein
VDSTTTLAADATTVAFLKDEPAAEDSFGAHHRVAKAIAGVIRTHPDAKIIGVLGPWGSGKSTVVKEVEREFAASPSLKTLFFTYDAWQHQSDPVRRSFLETFIHYLITKELVSEQKWRERSKELSGYLERTETTLSSTLTAAAQWMLVSIAFVPLGISFLDYGVLENALKNQPSGTALWAFRIGLVLTLLPLITGLLFYAWWRPTGLLRPSKGKVLFSRIFWNTHREPYSEESIVAVFANRSTERTRHVTAKRPEPTSIEFQETFRDLMADATANGHQFVFVIDNLDRLHELEALQIWSTIRGLFLGAPDAVSRERNPQFPTVLLPIDPDSIRRMFMASHEEGVAAGLAQAFMDKTFAVTFEVSEPVMSDWQGFLTSQLQAALRAEVDQDSAYWITKIFAARETSSGHKTTPRGINKFINAVISTSLQRPSLETSLVSIAFYVAHRNTIHEDIHGFLEREHRSCPPIDGWRAEVASLYYGVRPEKAMQIFLADPLNRSILKGDEASFEELSRAEGFGPALVRLISANPAINTSGNPSFIFVTNAVRLLDSLASDDAPWAREAWQHLADHYASIDAPDYVPEDLEARVKILTRRIPEIRVGIFVKATTLWLGKLFSTVSSDSKAAMTVIRAADEFLDYVEKNESALRYFEAEFETPTFKLDGDADGFLRLMARASAQPRVWKRFRTDTSRDAIVAQLVAKLDDPQQCSRVPPVLRSLVGADFADVITGAGQFEWAPLVDAAFALYEALPETESQAVVSASVLGILRSTSPAAVAKVQALLDKGDYESKTDDAYAAKDWDLLESLYAFHIVLDIDLTPPQGVSWSTVFRAHPTLAQGVRNKLDEFSVQ